MIPAALCAWPSMALAHSPIPGIGTFYGHMLHPLIVPVQALVLLGAALMLGQQGQAKARAGLLALGTGFACGLAAARLAASAPPETLLLLLAAVFGIAVGLARQWPVWLIVPAALGAGVALGLDSWPEPMGSRDTALAVAGLCVGVGLIALVVAGTALTLHKAWQRLGIRIVGSWIAAASVLVLALLVHAEGQDRVGALRIVTEERMPC
jgi:urease accessory protein